MPDWEAALWQVVLPVGMQPVAVPAGWEPFALGERQGNQASVICKRVAGGTPPAGAPVLTSLTPNHLPAGGVPLTVDVVGSGFDQSCTIYADEESCTTFFLDATHLEYTARPDLVTAPETRQITVRGDTGTSNALTFTFT